MTCTSVEVVCPRCPWSSRCSELSPTSWIGSLDAVYSFLFPGRPSNQAFRSSGRGTASGGKRLLEKLRPARPSSSRTARVALSRMRSFARINSRLRGLKTKQHTQA